MLVTRLRLRDFRSYASADVALGDRLTVVRPNDGSRVEPGARVHVRWRDEDAYEIQPPNPPNEQEDR